MRQVFRQGRTNTDLHDLFKLTDQVDTMWKEQSKELSTLLKTVRASVRRYKLEMTNEGFDVISGPWAERVELFTEILSRLRDNLDILEVFKKDWHNSTRLPGAALVKVMDADTVTSEEYYELSEEDVADRLREDTSTDILDFFD